MRQAYHFSLLNHRCALLDRIVRKVENTKGKSVLLYRIGFQGFPQQIEVFQWVAEGDFTRKSLALEPCKAFPKHLIFGKMDCPWG
jgi:hypothetical protein